MCLKILGLGWWGEGRTLLHTPGTNYIMILESVWRRARKQILSIKINNRRAEVRMSLWIIIVRKSWKRICICFRALEKLRKSAYGCNCGKGNEFNRLLLVPCEEKLLIGECAASAEYKVNVACKNNSALQWWYWEHSERKNSYACENLCAGSRTSKNGGTCSGSWRVEKDKNEFMEIREVKW